MGVCKDFNKDVVIHEYLKELMYRDDRLGLLPLKAGCLVHTDKRLPKCMSVFVPFSDCPCGIPSYPFTSFACFQLEHDVRSC